jgi:phage-related protein
MDISAKDWQTGISYKKDDIVRIDNLSTPNYVDINAERAIGEILLNLTDDQENFLQTDANEFIGVDVGDLYKGDVSPQVLISSSKETKYGFLFKVDPSIGYSAQAMIKKNTEESDLNDAYTTYLFTEEGQINKETSIGVGVGIKFYDKSLNGLSVADERKTNRAMASSELNHLEWYNAQLDIASEDIPQQAAYGIAFVFVYGHKSGGFDFKQIKASPLSQYFYCTEDNISSLDSVPPQSGYWTQEFHWRPSYNTRAAFSAINEYMKLGDGNDYITNSSINSLPLELSLNFNNRTDKQSKAIIHFLQEKHFPYDSIFSLSYNANKLLSEETGSFRFKYTYPYRKDLKFTCTNFSHNIASRNNNNIAATFVCNTESTLKSVDSHEGFNMRTDALLPVYIDQDTEFKKGEKITLNTFSLEEPAASELEGALSIEGSDFENGVPRSAIVKFTEAQNLDTQDCVYITAPENSIYNVGKVKVTEVTSDTEFKVGPILEEGDTEKVQNYQQIQYLFIKQLDRCPEDCLNSRPLFPDGASIINPEIIDPQSGEARKRIVFLKNYRRLILESPITQSTSSVTFTPVENFTLRAEEDFKLIIPAVTGRSSIYIEDPEGIPKYPWLKVRAFEHKPSFAFSVNQAPEHISTDFLDSYVKKYKKGINQNLFTLNLVFDLKTDREAAEILQFLESHLGYKKFRYDLPRPYIKDLDYITTPNRQLNSIFYCPAWEHTVVYKNNHTITATFVESVTSHPEDLRDVYGLYGRDEEGPCFAAKLANPITEHYLCTFSSNLQMAEGSGFSLDADGNKRLGAKNKAVDLVFIVDMTGSMQSTLTTGGTTVTKQQAAIDTILKMIVAHDDYVMPGTYSYGGEFEAPAISFQDISGDSNVPPWPVDASQKSLIDINAGDVNSNLKEKGYRVNNLERFKIKVDQKRVNIGFILMADQSQTVIDLSEIPDAFDKDIVYDSVIKVKDNRIPYGDGEYFSKVISKALAQMYNTPRAEYVTDRIIIILSDGETYTGDTSGGRGSKYSPSALQMCAALRKNGALAKRRPTDSVLGQYGHGGNTPASKMQEYQYQEKDGKSRLINPDLGSSNPSWYSEDLPTIVMFAGIGSPSSGVSSLAKNYVYDYDGASPYTAAPTKTPQFYFPITDGGVQSKELERLMDLIKTVEILTSDSGFNNLFSLTLHNCGPHEVEILNTLINIKSQAGPLQWTTELLRQGIPKGGDIKELELLESSETSSNVTRGKGGQYYNDPNNQSLFQEAGGGSNILWESFNTKYEVYRQGKIHEIDGGWNPLKESFSLITDSGENLVLDSGEEIITDPEAAGPIKTRGVLNTGVAFKGMPVRVFRAESGLEIVDYNIGNVNQSNNFKGDYSHLPKLKPNESLDLFFGLRVGRLSDISEEVQFVVHTDDGTLNKTDCYGNINFNIGSTKKLEYQKPTQEPLKRIVSDLVHFSDGAIGAAMSMAPELEIKQLTTNGSVGRYYSASGRSRSGNVFRVTQKNPITSRAIDVSIGKQRNAPAQATSYPSGFPVNSTLLADGFVIANSEKQIIDLYKKEGIGISLKDTDGGAEFSYRSSEYSRYFMMKDSDYIAARFVKKLNRWGYGAINLKANKIPTGPSLKSGYSPEEAEKGFMPEDVSNMLGSGEYKSATSSLKNVTETLDSILIKEDALLTMYDQPDFAGNVVLKETGPLLVYSKNASEYINSIDTEALKDTGIVDENGNLIRSKIKSVDNLNAYLNGSFKIEYIR